MKIFLGGVTMLSFRSITADDCEFILKHWAGISTIFGPKLDKNELISMIDSWDTKKYKENYYEMFGIQTNDVLIGTLSFYQRESDIIENAVYIGMEIGSDNRQRGFATDAMFMAFKIAKKMGYSKIFSQARIENTASVKLHAKCGYEIIEKAVSKRGYEVYNYIKTL